MSLTTAEPAISAPELSAHEAIAREPDLGRVIIGGLVGSALVFLVVRLDRGSRIDIAVTRTLQRWHGRRIDRAMALVSWPGFPPQSRLIPVGAIGAWLAVGLRTEAAFQAMAGGSAVLATVLKALARRPRPVATQVHVVIAPLGGTSFPSGHVLSYVGTYGFLSYLLGSRVKGRRMRRLVMALPLAMIALVGPSRIHQGHHWLTDVLASYLLGISYVAALAAIYRRWLSGGTTP